MLFMNLSKVYIPVLILWLTSASSQSKIGQWTDHLSYNSANSVSKVNNIVYASNGAGLITYNTDDNSVEKLTKSNGLSDIGVQLLRKNIFNNVLLPAPLRPMIPSTSPCCTSKLMFFNAQTYSLSA